MVPFGRLGARINPFVSIDGEEVDLNTVKLRSITLAQYKAARANSPGFEALYPLLDDEAFAYASRHIVKNCGVTIPGTYDWALVEVIVPELLKRLES